jgi:hypothetical protein
METLAPHPHEEIALVVVLPSLIPTTIIAATSPTFMPDQIRSISDFFINVTSPLTIKWSHGLAAITGPRGSCQQVKNRPHQPNQGHSHQRSPPHQVSCGGTITDAKIVADSLDGLLNLEGVVLATYTSCCCVGVDRISLLQLKDDLLGRGGGMLWKEIRESVLKWPSMGLTRK